MLSESKIYERLSVVAVIDPQSATAGTYDTTAIDMSKWAMILGIVVVGTMSASGTLDFKARECATSGGTYSDISGKAITQMTQAGSDSSKQKAIHLRADELSSGKQFVKFRVTTATAASLVAVVVVGIPAQRLPATDIDVTTLSEVIA